MLRKRTRCVCACLALTLCIGLTRMPAFASSVTTDQETQQELSADQAAVIEVEKRIAALPAEDVLAAGDERMVMEAKSAYDSLTKEQQAQVTNAETLEAAVSLMLSKKEAADSAAAYLVYLKIDALPSAGTLTTDNASEVEEARAALDALTAGQKALVQNADKLAKVERQMAILLELSENEEKATDMILRIARLPGLEEIGPDDEKNIENVTRAYEALTKEQQALVTNAWLLSEAALRLQESKQPPTPTPSEKEPTTDTGATPEDAALPLGAILLVCSLLVAVLTVVFVSFRKMCRNPAHFQKKEAKRKRKRAAVDPPQEGGVPEGEHLTEAMRRLEEREQELQKKEEVFARMEQELSADREVLRREMEQKKNLAAENERQAEKIRSLEAEIASLREDKTMLLQQIMKKEEE